MMFTRDRSGPICAFSIGAILLMAAAALLLGKAHPLEAATPTPTTTATPIATAGPAPVVAGFRGTAWVDGRPGGGRIEARVGTVVCGDATTLGMVDAGPSYNLAVASETEKAGCGRPGAVITFFVDGRQANETATWDSAAGKSQSLTLMVGAPFAQFWGKAAIAAISGDDRVVPYVGDKPCGRQVSSWMGSESPYGYQVVVYSADQQAGCGTESAEVTFKLLDGQGKLIAVAPEKGVWHAWDGESQLPRLDLTMVRTNIRMPPTGDGPTAGDPDWSWRIVLALVFPGIGLVCAGGVLRRACSKSLRRDATG